MRYALVIALLAVVSGTVFARPSNYYYRVSPSGSSLKQEPALCAKRPEYPSPQDAINRPTPKDYGDGVQVDVAARL